jgi:type VII secretion-associated serine protease mycosin
MGNIFLAITLVVLRATTASASDPHQWYLAPLHVGQAQAISKGDSAIVAVIDSGVDAGHPDLGGSVLRGTDLAAPPRSSDGGVDVIGHGTAMAGVIAAHGRVLGVAPQARILPIRALTDIRNDVGGSPDTIAAAVDWAVLHGANVINISAGEDVGSPAEQAAVERAVEHNVVVVAAAGNRPETARVWYPAAYPGVVAVTGVDRQGNHAAISVTGPEAVIAAPAVDIFSTDIRTGDNSGYSIGNGTSGAAAIVSGVVALIRSKFPKLSAAEVVHRLTATADDRGSPGRDPVYGYGIVDPVKALTADVPPLTSQPTSVPTATAHTAAGNGSHTNSFVLIGLTAVAVVIIISVAFGMRRRES